MGSLATLVRQGEIRNRLLMAKTVNEELRKAAERVARLTKPGTSERFFTLVEVAQSSGFTTTAIVNEIGDARRRAKRSRRPARKEPDQK